MVYLSKAVNSGGLEMSEKIELRVLEKADLEFIHRLNNNADIMSYWFDESYKSMTQLEKAYEKSIDNKDVRQFIIEKDNEQLGYVALFSIDPIHRKAEFGIMIDPKHQGHGYASIATDLAIDYAFSTLNLNKLYLIVDRINEKAIHVYEKMGFEMEALLKEEYFVNGSFHDVSIMSIFQRDYLEKRKNN